MSTWAEAHRLSSATLSKYTRGENAWEHSLFLAEQRYRHNRYAKLTAHTCYFCGGHSKLTTGMLPDLGAIFKCPGCRDEYLDLVQAIEEELK